MTNQLITLTGSLNAGDTLTIMVPQASTGTVMTSPAPANFPSDIPWPIPAGFVVLLPGDGNSFKTSDGVIWTMMMDGNILRNGSAWGTGIATVLRQSDNAVFENQSLNTWLQWSSVVGFAGALVASPFDSGSTTGTTSGTTTTSTTSSQTTTQPVADPIISLPPSTGSLTLLNQITASAALGSFVELSNTTIGTVLETRDMAPYDGAVGGAEFVFEAWGACAWDAAKHQAYFCGGGHMDYSGNEVYIFDFQSLKWGRLTNSSPVVIANNGVFGSVPQSAYSTSDGAPLSSHTYDGMAWCPLTNTFFLCTGSMFPTGNADNKIYEYDPASAKWTFIGQSPISNEWPSLKWFAANKKLLLFVGGAAVWLDPITKTFGAVGPYFADLGTIVGTTDGAMNYYFLGAGDLFKVELSDPPALALSILDITAVGPVSDRAMNISSILSSNNGVAWDSKRKLLTFWDGKSNVWTYDPASKLFGKYIVSNAPSVSYTGVFSKFQYIAESDVFWGFDDVERGVWVFKPTTQPEVLVPLLGAVTVANADGTNAVKFNSFQAACDAVKDGQMITCEAFSAINTGIINANNVTIKGVSSLVLGKTDSGTHLRDATTQGEIGLLVINGNNTTVVNMEISGARGGGDSSAIRLLGKNLTIGNCWLHGSEMNFLSGGDNGDIVFDGGMASDSAVSDQLNHNVYIGSNDLGTAHSAVFKNGFQSLRANGLGHLLKSRAYVTTVTGCTLDMGNSMSSRVIDISDGGIVTVSGSTLRVGPNSDNNDAIGIALELVGDVASGNAGAAVPNPSSPGSFIADPARTHNTSISGNTVINDMTQAAHTSPPEMIVHSRSPGTVTLSGNKFAVSISAVIGIQDTGFGGSLVDDGTNVIGTKVSLGL